MTDTKKESARPVGRPRAFDRETALDAALLVFWEHGYEAASLVMLCEAMGLTPPQVYNAYTDKENLFRLALDRYVVRQSEFVVQALAAGSTAREAVGRLLSDAAVVYTRPGYPQGCLTVTGALVASPAAIGVVQALRGYRKLTEQQIAARLSQDKGELPAGTDIDGLARFFTGVLLGMSVLARDGKSQEELREYAEIALRAWHVRTD